MATKEENQERAQLVRVHEANCDIQYPTPEELTFRMAIMKKLAVTFGLKELRAKTFSPTTPAAASPPAKR